MSKKFALSTTTTKTSEFMMKWLKTANPNSKTIEKVEKSVSKPDEKQEITLLKECPEPTDENDMEEVKIIPAMFVVAVYNYSEQEEEKLYNENDGDIDYIAHILERTCEVNIEMDLYDDVDSMASSHDSIVTPPRKRPLLSIEDRDVDASKKSRKCLLFD